MLFELFLWNKAKKAEDTADAALISVLPVTRKYDDVFRSRRLRQERFAGWAIFLSLLAWILLG